MTPQSTTSEAGADAPEAAEAPSTPPPSDVAPAEVAEVAAPAEPSLDEQLDRLSLEQALADFAIANARVLDLTRRLTELSSEVARLSDENARLRIRAGQLAVLEGSSGFQVLRVVRASEIAARKVLKRARRR
jgi:hypothetical protein